MSLGLLHASAAMTLDVYADLSNGDLSDVADQLDTAARAALGDSATPSGMDTTMDKWTR